MTRTPRSSAQKIVFAVAVFVATALAVLGLAVVAGFVLLYVGMNNYGSNK